MTKKLTYKVLRFVGQEKPTGNPAFDSLEKEVNRHLAKGWQVLDGVGVASVVGPKTLGSSRDNWYVRVAQAVVRDE